MTERPKVTVLKTVVGQPPTVGSNPTRTAKKISRHGGHAGLLSPALWSARPSTGSLLSSCGRSCSSPYRPMWQGRTVNTVEDMEQILNFLSIIGQVSAVLFGVMVLTAMAMAAFFSHRRSDQESAEA